jgi:hypothetical protein
VEIQITFGLFFIPAFSALFLPVKHQKCSEEYYFVLAERCTQIAAQGVPLERNTHLLSFYPQNVPLEHL